MQVQIVSIHRDRGSRQQEAGMHHRKEKVRARMCVCMCVSCASASCASASASFVWLGGGLHSCLQDMVQHAYDQHHV